MNIVKPLAIVAVAISMALAGGSSAFAKGHDQGVADGTQTFGPGDTRGLVGGPNTAGIGGDAGPLCEDGLVFCGVADINDDINYGQNIVQGQVANDARRVKPCEGVREGQCR